MGKIDIDSVPLLVKTNSGKTVRSCGLTFDGNYKLVSVATLDKKFASPPTEKNLKHPRCPTIRKILVADRKRFTCIPATDETVAAMKQMQDAADGAARIVQAGAVDELRNQAAVKQAEAAAGKTGTITGSSDSGEGSGAQAGDAGPGAEQPASGGKPKK